MIKHINLSIDTPCSQKFSDFKSTPLGGFCSSCQKEVIDFTQMSDDEIINHFQNKKQAKTCGQFDQSQLNTFLVTSPPPQKNRFSVLGTGLLGFSLLTFLSVNHGQAQHKELVKEIQLPQDKVTEETNPQESKPLKTITGVISDNEDLLLPGVNIIIKGTNKGVCTDLDGQFRLNSVKIGDVLIINYIGYQTQEIEISPQIKNLKIKMKISQCQLLGEVAVHEVYSSKRTFWQKLTSKR